MSWDLAQCEDSELIKIADRLNRCKESKIMLDLELCNEEFKLKYIHKRRQLTASKARTRMVYIIPFTIVEIACIVLFVTSVISLKTVGYSIATLISMLISLLGFIFCGYFCIRLWLPEIKMFGKLNPFGKNRDEDKGVVTFEVERQKSEERISVLKAEIDTVEKEIEQLSGQKRKREVYLCGQMLEEKAKTFLDPESGKNSENVNASQSGLFTLRKDKLSNIQIAEQIEECNSELRRLEREKTRLELEDKKLQDGIIDIDVQMLEVRDKVTAFVLIVAILTIIVSLFTGTVMHILGVVWCIIVLPYMFWLFNVCKKPVVLYLVEHDHKQIQDYAFTQSLTPLYKKRKELARDIADCKRWINNTESKLQELKAEE